MTAKIIIGILLILAVGLVARIIDRRADRDHHQYMGDDE